MSLERIFVGSSMAKLLDVLWEYQDIDLMLSDISIEVGVDDWILMEDITLLQEINVVKAKYINKTMLYQLNKDDIITKKLIEFLNKLNLRLVERGFVED